MRSDKPKKGKTGLLIAILLFLGALQIAAGTFVLIGVRLAMNDGTFPKSLDEFAAQYYGSDINDAPGITDESGDALEGEDKDDPAEGQAEDKDSTKTKDDDEDEEEDDEDKDDDDKKKNYVVMTVRATDNFAAVRKGPGTGYEEVGRITNGHRVALTDLNNGWYKIAKGKYKGYYTHESSYARE